VNEAEANTLELRVLVLAPTQADAAASRDVLGHGGFAHAICAQPNDVRHELEAGVGVVILTEAALRPPGGCVLEDWLRTQPAWSDLPIVLLMRGGPEALTPPLGPYGNLIVLDRPVRVATLVSVVRSALLARRRQYQIRDHLAQRARDQEALRHAHAELERRVEERTAELCESQARALQAERLAAIGQMVAGLAHESRNALQRCQSCLSVLSVKLGDRPDLLDLLNRMQAAQDDLLRLFDEVRAYAAPVHVEIGPCDLAKVWRQAWADLEPLRHGRVAFLHEALAVPTTCRADGFHIKQVFRNVLENALSAAADPVHVSIDSAAAALRGHPAVRLRIRDNGPGFAGVERRKVFEPFVTTKLHGTGLGLAICKRIVDAHGGTIAVGDGEGQGAEIIITLPRGTS
jgi:signal transduction histidine kinase